MNREVIRNQWNKNGYIIIPNLLDSEYVERLREICDAVLEQWVKEFPVFEDAANSTNMAFLTESRYFTKHPERLKFLLNAIADAKILAILSCIYEGELLFHNTQYFFNPLSRTRSGDWHRDQQFGAPNEETEKLRMLKTVGIHVHIAFLPDDNLEYVAGTHARWDTPKEIEIRKGLNNKPKNSPEMPNSIRIVLNAGDAVFFSAWGIHRGNYIQNKLRRTFDVIYGSQPDWYTPPPTCFLQSDILYELTSQAKEFFQRYIETYREKWLKGEYDI